VIAVCEEDRTSAFKNSWSLLGAKALVGGL
jgi:hypothetical protein